MRNLCMLAAAVVLSACASTASDEPAAKFTNAVYRVGDQPAPTPTLAKPDDGKSGMPAKPGHLYWFFGG